MGIVKNKKMHHYTIHLNWTGNRGTGTSGYEKYARSYTIQTENKPLLEGSSDPAFLGDRSKYNPEELLVASLSSCHMLWFLHLCADTGVVVTNYTDNPKGIMAKDAKGFMRFKEVILQPAIEFKHPIDEKTVNNLHRKANSECFIANSVNFPVNHSGTIRIKER